MSNMEEFYKECQEKLIKNSKLCENGECILWTGAVSRGGYGNFRYLDPGDRRYKTHSAHRVSLMLKVKNFNVSPRLHASHLCNNKLCVNAEHIRFEPSQVNCQRRTCFKMSRCNGHLDRNGNCGPDCLIHLSP